VREHRLEVADVFREHGEEFLKQWGHTVHNSGKPYVTSSAAALPPWAAT
jgi:hypothetical protein